MLERLREFSCWLGVDPSLSGLVVILLLILSAVKCAYPWKLEWKSKISKDEDGNTVTKYFHMDV